MLLQPYVTYSRSVVVTGHMTSEGRARFSNYIKKEGPQCKKVSVGTSNGPRQNQWKRESKFCRKRGMSKEFEDNERERETTGMCGISCD